MSTRDALIESAVRALDAERGPAWHDRHVRLATIVVDDVVGALRANPAWCSSLGLALGMGRQS